MVSNSQNNQFYQNDLDLDPLTLILKLDLDMVKMYHQTKDEVTMSSHSKVTTRMDRHTDTMKTLFSRIRGQVVALDAKKYHPVEEKARIKCTK